MIIVIIKIKVNYYFIGFPCGLSSSNTNSTIHSGDVDLKDYKYVYFPIPHPGKFFFIFLFFIFYKNLIFNFKMNYKIII